MKKLLNRSLFVSLFAIVAVLAPTYAARADLTPEECRALFAKAEAKGFGFGSQTGVAAMDFATIHHLPTQIIEVGPAERRVQRVAIGLDATNPKLMQAYRDKFNFHASPGPGDVESSLVLEFAWEQGKTAAGGESGHYVTGVFRPDADPTKPIYRWGRPDLSYNDWWRSFFIGRNPLDGDSPILGFAHVFGLSKEEAANVKVFLEHPELRAKCKADNCVAWTSSIELGKTGAGVLDADRNFLFSELGMSRSMAHFEIGRRLVHAANERHSTMFVFLNGEKGAAEFKNLPKYLPPNPKIPFVNVIKGLGLPPDSPILGAMKTIPDGAKIFFPIAAGASPEAFTALTQLSASMGRGVDVHMLVNGISESAIQTAVGASGNKLRIHALFLGGNMRKVYHEGKVNLIPGYLGDFPKLVAEGAPEFKYDAMVVRVSPPDAEGRYSLGPNNDMIMSIIRDRPGIKIIAEVNPNVPFTTGENFIREQQIAAKFTSDAELAGPAVVPLTDVEKTIGVNLGKLIPSDAYLQIGIGNIFGGLPAGLQTAGSKNVRVFTEMFGDPLMEAMKNGTVTEAQTGFAYGSGAMYKWLDHNPAVKFEETAYVNNPARISALPKFHAVNTALQVDLYGNVNAMIGPGGRRISSPGGQVEFMQGASRSVGGKSIIAIRSTAKEGTLSTISMDLYRGPVTTPHEMVGYVVTEYGVANLAGKSERERALALIQIAHPNFRKQLAQEASERGLIRAEDAARY